MLATPPSWSTRPRRPNARGSNQWYVGRKPVAQITAPKPVRSSSVGTWVRPVGLGLTAGPTTSGQVVLVHPLVDAAEQPGLLQIGIGDEASQATRAQRCRAADRHEAPYELDADALQGGEVDLSTVLTSDHLHRCVPAGTLEVLHLVPSLVELADPVQPPVDVASPVRTRQPYVLADRDGDVTAGPSQLVRDLHP